MKLIAKPKSLPDFILNAVFADLYDRSCFDHWFDRIDPKVVREELIPRLRQTVSIELERVNPMTDLLALATKTAKSAITSSSARDEHDRVDLLALADRLEKGGDWNDPITYSLQDCRDAAAVLRRVQTVLSWADATEKYGDEAAQRMAAHVRSLLQPPTGVE